MWAFSAEWASPRVATTLELKPKASSPSALSWLSGLGKAVWDEKPVRRVNTPPYRQGSQTDVHQGPRQPHGCLHRAKIILGLYECNYSLTVKELKLHLVYNIDHGWEKPHESLLKPQPAHTSQLDCPLWRPPLYRHDPSMREPSVGQQIPGKGILQGPATGHLLATSLPLAFGSF